MPSFRTATAAAAVLLPSRLIPAAVLVLLACVPLYAALASEPFYVTFFTRLLIYAVAATGLNLALGFGGLIGFGHALFMGLGAYCVALPAYYGIDNGWLQLILALAVCGAVGGITGLISLRTHGIAFIMITLAFSQMGYFAFVSLRQYGGDDGMTIDRTSRLAGLDLGTTSTLYWVTLALLLALLAWMARLRAAPFGMTLRGARQNARRVGALGLPAARYQLAAYAISAMLCGTAGYLLANLTTFASPGMMSWQVSGELIVMIVLGGLGTVCGPLYGALIFLGLEEAMKMFTDHGAAILGPLIVLIALTGGKGVAGLLAALDERKPRGGRAERAVQ